MTARTVELAELGERGAADLLREVAQREEILTVELPNGKRISIQPLPDLDPLPELEGYIEEGWKDVIYGHTEGKCPKRTVRRSVT